MPKVKIDKYRSTDITRRELNKLKNNPEFQKNKLGREMYLRGLLRELEKRSRRGKLREQFITPNEEKLLTKKYTKQFIVELIYYGLNANQISDIEDELKTLGIDKPTVLDYSKEGFYLNDVVAYLACNSAIALGIRNEQTNKELKRKTIALRPTNKYRNNPCRSVKDLQDLGLLQNLFTVGDENSALRTVGNVVEIKQDQRTNNITGMNAQNIEKSDEFYIDETKITLGIHPSLSAALKKEEKILYFVAASGNNHSTLFVLLENGELFSFGLTAQMNADSSLGNWSGILSQATSSGTIFLSSPDGVYNRYGKGLAYIQGTLGETAKKIMGTTRDNIDFQIADIGQLRRGHIQRILYMAIQQAKGLIVTTEDTEIQYDKLTKKLFSVSSVLDESKAKYSLLALGKDGYNCAYMLEWIFQERLTCAIYGTRQPVACRRNNKQQYLNKEEIQEIIDVYTSQYSTRADLIEVTKVPGEDHKYDIDNLNPNGINPNGIVNNPSTGWSLQGIARGFSKGLKF